jgi:eukaryotic-like serine/threonine-protein kinase
MVGKTLRFYRIESKLGSGGMGVVYKAVDSHLDRPAAIKVLNGSAAGAEREKRFIQEAKAASSLNHANIVTIYDIDTQEIDGSQVRYIAMEYVAGQTLDQLIGRKGLPVRTALKYASQIADALAAAHAAGIVHRDLKPSNVMVTPQGVVKVLDFGLAKLNEEETEADAFAETVHGEHLPLTEEGTILGTMAYMSPEQAEGNKVDARSDIFSFGSVLYEIVTGHRAFNGKSKLSSLSAVLHQEPAPASRAAPDVPAELDRIIARCLKKDPSRRWQSMADVKVALDELRDEMESSTIEARRQASSSQSSAGPALTGQASTSQSLTGQDSTSQSSAGPASMTARRSAALLSRRWLVAGSLGLLLLGLALGAYAARRLLRVTPVTFQRVTFRRGDISAAKFGPGDEIVYSAEWDGAPSTMFSTRPGNREARQLGLPTGKILSISHRGEMAILLGDDTEGTLASVPFSGGTPRELLENVSGADWSPSGDSLAVVRTVGGKHRLEYPVGTVLYETSVRPPLEARISPDGKLVAFFDYDSEVGDYSLCVIDPNHLRRVLSPGWRAVGALNWSPRGDEIWFSAAQPSTDPALYAVNLAGKQRFLAQTPAYIVMQDVAPDGRVLLSTVNSRLGIRYVDFQHSTERDLAWLDASFLYEISNDGRNLLFVELSYGEGRNSAIYLRRTDGSAAVRLGYGNRPALSPDGKWVVCIRRDPGLSRMLLLPTGPGELRFLNVESVYFDSLGWFPDSKRIIFTGNETGHPRRTWMYDLDSDKATPLTPEGTRGSLVSPDGRWFLIVAGNHLSLAPVGGGTPRTIAELENDEMPVRWNADGTALFLEQVTGNTIKISRLDLASGKKESWQTVRIPEPGAAFIGNFALSADGKACAFSFQHDLANLFLVKGLK